jgi:hypothetical protein
MMNWYLMGISGAALERNQVLCRYTGRFMPAFVAV